MKTLSRKHLGLAVAVLNCVAFPLLAPQNRAPVMYLENSQVLGSGPTGPSVLLNLNLSFKPKAAGRVFRVEAFATDDDGNQQGFDEAGIIGVLRK